MEHETFFTLLKDPAHWLFEIFLIFIFDGIIGLLIWPRCKRFFRHHASDDQRIEILEKKIEELEEKSDPSRHSDKVEP
jgi:hypothetical protein